MKGFGSGGMQAMMRQANQMQARMKKAQEEMATKEFAATSGGGAVSATVSGDGKMKALVISNDVFESGDAEMLQDMVVSAVNEALKIAKTTSEQEMAKITGGYSLPGMF